MNNKRDSLSFGLKKKKKQVVINSAYGVIWNSRQRDKEGRVILIKRCLNSGARIFPLIHLTDRRMCIHASESARVRSYLFLLFHCFYLSTSCSITLSLTCHLSWACGVLSVKEVLCSVCRSTTYHLTANSHTFSPSSSPSSSFYM